jgi:hypothetical protein
MTSIVQIGTHIPSAPGGLVFGVGSGGGGGGSFFADPFSAFANVIADTTFGGTAGATTTVSWNGGTISGPTYSTLQAAVNAAAAAGPGGSGRRVCGLLNQVWNVSASPISIPSTAAFSASLPFVMQGDPIATDTQMPNITGGGAGTTGIVIGDLLSGGGGPNNSNVLVRKWQITNFINAGTGVSGIHLASSGGGQYTGAIIEFCDINTFQATGSAGESGPVYCPSVGSTGTIEVRFCKLTNVQLPGGGINENHSCIGLYGGTVNIHHNYMAQAYNCIRFKVCNTNVPQGNIVTKNIIGDSQCGISTNNGGEGPSPNGMVVSNNLFWWQNLNNALWQSGSAAFNDFGSNTGSTTPTGTQFFNNTITVGWGASGGEGQFLNVATLICQVFNNITLGPTPIWTDEAGKNGSLATCDFNAYFVGSWIMNAEGSPQITITTFAGWQAAHTNNPSLTGLASNPDAHGLFIPSQGSPFNTIAGNFPNASTGDYSLAVGSPMIGAGQGGVNMGYIPTDCGPGW